MCNTLTLERFPDMFQFPRLNSFHTKEDSENYISNMIKDDLTIYKTYTGEFNSDSLYDIINYGILKQFNIKPDLYFGIYAKDLDTKEHTLIVTENPEMVMARINKIWGTLIVSDNEIKYLLKEYTENSINLKSSEYGSLVNSKVFREKLLFNIKQEITASINYYLNMSKDIKFSISKL